MLGFEFAWESKKVPISKTYHCTVRQLMAEVQFEGVLKGGF